ncbi:MAG TPA: hypothetical protein VF236_10660 [Gaiellaceae bacterium]
MRRAARAVPLLLVLALVAAALPAGAGADAEQTPSPRISLVSPAHGALVRSSHVTFAWRVEWPRSLPAPAGTVQVVHLYASDAALTREVSTTSRTCPAANVNCWSKYRPSATFYGRYYWQVSLSGAVQATSGTFLFSATGPRTKPDRARPLVRALGGTATRGQRAVFAARVRDDSGEARLDAQLLHRGLKVVQGQTSFAPAAWAARQRFRSTRPLPARFPAGAYTLCVTAWDRAGNRSRHCARYRVR